MEFWKIENVKIENFGIWEKWKIEKSKNGKFGPYGTKWYQNGTKMVPLWYHMVP